MPDSIDPTSAAQLAANPLKGGVLIDLFRPLAAEERSGPGADVTAAQAADYLAAVISSKNLKIALAAVAAWERG